MPALNRAIIALNNAGASLLERGFHEACRKTFRDAVRLMRSLADESKEAQGSAAEEALKALHETVELTCRFQIPSEQMRPLFPLSIDCTSGASACLSKWRLSPLPSWAPIYVEKNDYESANEVDIDLLCACVLHNAGVAYALCGMKLPRGDSSLKHCKTANRFFSLSMTCLDAQSDQLGCLVLSLATAATQHSVLRYLEDERALAICAKRLDHLVLLSTEIEQSMAMLLPREMTAGAA